MATAAVVCLSGAALTTAGMSAPAAAAAKTVWSAENPAWCLEANLSTGRPVVKAPCSGAASGLWYFQEDTGTVGNNDYFLVNASGVANNCLEQEAWDQPYLRIAWCSGASKQSWMIRYQDPGNVLINRQNQGRCLEMTLAPNGFPTGAVNTSPCNYSLNQQWYNN